MSNNKKIEKCLNLILDYCYEKISIDENNDLFNFMFSYKQGYYETMTDGKKKLIMKPIADGYDLIEFKKTNPKFKDEIIKEALGKCIINEYIKDVSIYNNSGNRQYSRIKLTELGITKARDNELNKKTFLEKIWYFLKTQFVNIITSISIITTIITNIFSKK